MTTIVEDGRSDMLRAFRAEWTKLRTEPGTVWILAAICLLTVAVGAGTAAVTRCGAGAGCATDPTKVSPTGIEVGQAVVAALAVLVISNEYSTGMIRVTLTAMPRRWTVLAAKAAVLYLALVGLLTLGIATIVRDSAAATGAVLGVL